MKSKFAIKVNCTIQLFIDFLASNDEFRLQYSEQLYKFRFDFHENLVPSILIEL